MKHAAEARFPSIVVLPAGEGAVIACDEGAVKGAKTVAIEQL